MKRTETKKKVVKIKIKSIKQRHEPKMASSRLKRKSMSEK